MKGYMDQLHALGKSYENDMAINLINKSLNKDFGDFVRNFNMHCVGKIVTELQALLIDYVIGRYEDDEDSGDVIVYTGHDGQDKHSRQVVHQKSKGGNLSMERSMHYEIEVAVIRGFKYEGSASGNVYVYDGLYKINEARFDVGKLGFGVFKFNLVKIENQVEIGSAVLKFVNTLRTRPLEARPVGCLSFDISMKKEKDPMFLFTDIDNNHEPMYYEYLATTVFLQFVYHLKVKRRV
nr:histone-lysine N-methyltransferase family member SUVH9-like [Tanacetum cinerariifolium]